MDVFGYDSHSKNDVIWPDALINVVWCMYNIYISAVLNFFLFTFFKSCNICQRKLTKNILLWRFLALLCDARGQVERSLSFPGTNNPGKACGAGY